MARLMPLNEPLIPGFALLRAFQLLNFDVYYINSKSRSEAAVRDVENASQHQIVNNPKESQYCRTVLDDLNDLNPVRKYVEKHQLVSKLARIIKISLSLLAIVLAYEKLGSTILLCLSATKNNLRKDLQGNTNTSVGLVVLVFTNFASVHILFSVIFNGHLVWDLLSQPLFLVSRQFQQKTMLYLLAFAYLEYLINISFVNNLYQWDFTSNNIESSGFSALANLRILVTSHDSNHYLLDTLLTIFQFARGIIYMSPYITVNYTLICLKEHIYTIRKQHLMINSLKKPSRLASTKTANKGQPNQNRLEGSNGVYNTSDNNNRAHQVSFTTDSIKEMARGGNHIKLNSLDPASSSTRRPAPVWNAESDHQSGCTFVSNNSALSLYSHDSSTQYKSPTGMRPDYRNRIRDFNELEAYVTSLYIFGGRLNQVVAGQGITVFFIVHNLLISSSVLVPESVRGGPLMAQVIQGLLVLIAVVPFLFGQMLYAQLDLLSKQIDRLIIQQQFIRNKRDNLVRIRQLVHDIRVGCGGMLNYNIESGIKYLVVAFASAFFIEQERK